MSSTTSAFDTPVTSLDPASSDDVKLDQPITTGGLLKFALPTILSTIAMSAFGMVDGIFASRIISPEAFAATGIVWPFISLAMAIGFMLSIGGSAYIAKIIAEGKAVQARSVFSMLTLVTLGMSALLSAIGLLFPDFILNILGSLDTGGGSEFLRPFSLEYLRPLLVLLPFAMLGFFIQQYFVTEGKPTLGFVAAIIGGSVNIGLNFLLIREWGWGLRGAAIATGIGWAVPALFGIIYFALNRRGTLYFTRPTWDIRALGRAAANGASEMVTMLAGAVTTVVMNNILMRMVGFEGVAAVGIMFVGQMLMMSAFMGYAAGIAPIVSFNHGKRDTARLQKIFNRSVRIIIAIAASSIVLGWLLASPLTRIYVPEGTNIYEMAIHAFRIGLIGFVFMGINQFASTWFAALNNGKINGLLAFFRTFVFMLLMLSLLPAILDHHNGVWLALPAAETLALSLSTYFLLTRRKVYGYGKVLPRYGKRRKYVL